MVTTVIKENIKQYVYTFCVDELVEWLLLFVYGFEEDV